MKFTALLNTLFDIIVNRVISTKKPNNFDSDEAQKSFGIRIIENIVAAVVAGSISGGTQILAAIKQILFFYKLLPDEWKRKAYEVFTSLWDKKSVGMSTQPQLPEQIYNVSFDDPKIEELIRILPLTDAAIMHIGKAISNLITKGLHAQSEIEKESVSKHYGKRGLNIIHIITTGDIQYIVEECRDKNTEEKLRIFNFWADNYLHIALLASSELLASYDDFVSLATTIAGYQSRDYMLVNMSGNMNDITTLITYVDKLKTDGKLNYKGYISKFYTSGFNKSIKIKINL